MSEHRVTVVWNGRGESFAYESYTRDHEWRFGDGIRVEASAAGEFFGDPSRVNPEQGLVAALSGCHMLTFLAIASKKRFVVESYEDDATGYLEKDESGRLVVTRIVLRPRILFGGEKPPSAEEIERLHQGAHKHCMIANSIRSEVSVEPPPA